MRLAPLVCLLAIAGIGGAVAQEPAWRLERVSVPAHVNAIETVGDEVRVQAGGLWYRLRERDGKIQLVYMQPPKRAPILKDALPDGRIAAGSRDIARAWLAEPTKRYDHGVLGDAVEAASLVIETAEGKRHTVDAGNDAVFEDLSPRLADLDGDGQDEVIVVKSYLKRGAALAVIASQRGRYRIVAETPPLGRPHRWLDPAGIADFTGDGKPEIAFVRQPHVVGMLELWSLQSGRLRKLGEIPDTANHVIGSRAIDMSAAADFDGDGKADIALASRDRTRLRMVSFAPQPREIASLALPAKAVTDFGLLTGESPAVALGLADGSLVVLRRGD